MTADRELVGTAEVSTDVLGSLAALGDGQTRDRETRTRSLSGTVDIEDRITLRGSRSGNSTNGNTADRQRGRIFLGTVRHLVLVTVVSGDNNWVIRVDDLVVIKFDLGDRTLSTRPGLDTKTVLTVGTDTVDNIDITDGFSSTALTETANTETMTAGTVDIINGDILNTTVDSSTVITNKEVGILEDNVLRRRDIQSIGVLGKVAVGRNGLQVNIVEDKVVGTSDTHMSSRGVENVEMTEIRVGSADSKDSRSGSILDIPPGLTVTNDSSTTREVDVVTLDRDISITALELLIEGRQNNLTLEVDSDTLQAGDSNHALQVVSGALGEINSATVLTVFESLGNGERVIAAAFSDSTSLASGLNRGS